MPVQTQIQVRRGTASSWTSTNPTLAAGEIGFETDTGKIKVGNGSSTWSALNYVGAANAIQYVYNASAGQTSFSGADSNSLTLSYTVGAEQVYVNGVLQVRGSDYTATNGTSVTLTTATIASDVVTIVAFGTFDIANTYTQAQANATFPLNTSSFFAGKNAIINGNFAINQRGFSSTTTNNTYTFDRWLALFDVNGGGTVTYSAQTFTPGTAPVAGYESSNFIRVVSSGQTGAGNYSLLDQRIEDARTFAGQTVTISFWAKASSGTPSVAASFYRNYGTGGSPSASEWAVSAGQKVAITTSWARYSMTFNITSVSGKTFGTTANTSYLEAYIWTSAGSNWNTYTNSLGLQAATIDIWGVQLEAGSVATAFETATGTIQGELAACQRYYFRTTGQIYSGMATGFATSTTGGLLFLQMPVSMRVAPTALEYGNVRVIDSSFAGTLTTLALTTQDSSNVVAELTVTGTGYTAHRPIWLSANNNAAGYVAVTAEL